MKRDYLPYCFLCFRYGHCNGPLIEKTDDLLGDWEGLKETSCRKFQFYKATSQTSCGNKQIKMILK